MEYGVHKCLASSPFVESISHARGRDSTCFADRISSRGLTPKRRVELRGLTSMAATLPLFLSSSLPNSSHVVLCLYSVFSIQPHSLPAPLPVPIKQLISFVVGW